MGKVARNVVLGLTISVSVAAAAAEPAAAKRALHHYAASFDMSLERRLFESPGLVPTSKIFWR
jgi:hypothetical protein